MNKWNPEIRKMEVLNPVLGTQNRETQKMNKWNPEIRNLEVVNPVLGKRNNEIRKKKVQNTEKWNFSAQNWEIDFFFILTWSF
tara:strand:+ start:259 stop:507 length:249 start_codon:yes stop_codon:yes gene_type:complete